MNTSTDEDAAADGDTSVDEDVSVDGDAPLDPSPEPDHPAVDDAGADDGIAAAEHLPVDDGDAAPAPIDAAPDEAANPAADARASVPGMGAVLHDGGVAFRVWAPNATAVSVAGSFNEWSADAHHLAHEGGGYWYADVPGAGTGAAYKFVIHTHDGERLWRRDPYARDMESSVGNCLVMDPAFDWSGDQGFVMPPWHELVIYEIHVGTFSDQAGWEPGNLEGVIRRLDYLRDLGINCIELMPTSEFAMDHSLGYNPAHIFAVEQAYGGPNGLKQLVVEAHNRGIAVILDVVYNHFGPSDLDLWRFDGWHDGKGGIYFYNDWRSTTPWGDTRPDYGRPEVRQFIRDNALYWLNEFRMDGLRWDVTNYLRNVHGGGDPGADLADGWELMRAVNAEVRADQPWKLIIAEDLQKHEGITRSADEGGAGFGTQWDAEFVHPVREALIARDDEHRSMGRMARSIAHRYGGDPWKRVVYTESHDEVRNGRARIPYDVWAEQPGSWVAQKRATLGTALVLTVPGIPMLFQGQEFLEDGWFEAEDPLDWTKLDRFGGIHAMHRDLIRLRRNWFDNTRGLRGAHVRVHHVNDADKVVAFHRWEQGGPGDDVIVVANFGARAWTGYEIGFPGDGEWKVRFNGDWNGYSADFGGHPSWHVHADGGPRDGMPASGAVSVGAYTVVILSRD